MRWIYCGNDFVKDLYGNFYPREVVEEGLQLWHVAFKETKQNVPNFAICLPPQGGVFFEIEKENENAQVVVGFMIKSLSLLGIIHIPMTVVLMLEHMEGEQISIDLGDADGFRTNFVVGYL